MLFPAHGVAPGALQPLAYGAAASVATLLGGVSALRVGPRVAPVLAVTAGVVVGVALFDLLPEAFALSPPGTPLRRLFGFAAAGLGLYLLLERALGAVAPARAWRAHLGPATLTLHSLLDGLGIGFAFQVSAEVGGLVTLAVLTHDIADGVNIVSLCLAAGRHAAARGWLVANAAAPLAGVLLGLSIRVPGALLAPMLAAMAGVFVQIGAGELLPRSRALDPRPRTTIAGLLGIALMYAVAAK